MTVSKEDNDPLDDLRARKQELSEQIAKHDYQFKDKRGSTLFWGAIATACFVGDATIFGGVLTAIAGVRAADAVGARIRVAEKRKELKKIEKSIDEVVKQRAIATPDPAMKKKIQSEFSEAAKQEIAALNERVNELQEQIDLQKQAQPAKKITLRP